MSSALRISTILATSLALVLVISACSTKPAEDEHGAEHGAEAAHAEAGHGEADAHGKTDAHGDEHGAPSATKISHWGYSGDEGPAHWAQLGGEAAVCGTGKRQSPVDLTGATRPQASKINMDYLSSTTTIQNNGHSITMVPTKGGGLVVDSVRYELKNIHFHSPSEHTIYGLRAALETHFVHQNAKGEYLVVGVLSNIGVADPVLGSVWTYLPPDQTPPALVPDLLINARDLMPSSEEFYVYAGSLTVPPCSEGVTWMVYAAPLSVSPEQVSAYEALFGSTARPLQARKDRDVLNVMSAG